MTSEEVFIGNLAAYLDLTLNEFDKCRILGYLKDYVDGLEPKVIHKEKIVEKVIYVEGSKPIKLVTQTDLERDAATICNECELPYDLFIKSNKRRGANEIAEVRKKFCIHIMANYKCSQEKLRAFFDVNHASINYYLGNKKVKIIKRQLPQKQTA